MTLLFAVDSCINAGGLEKDRGRWSESEINTEIFVRCVIDVECEMASLGACDVSSSIDFHRCGPNDGTASSVSGKILDVA